MTVPVRSAPPAPDGASSRPPAAGLRRARTELEIATQQVEGIERFNRSRRQQELAEAAASRSREMRMDAARRLEVLRRQHDAIVRRSEQQLRCAGDRLGSGRGRTVLLAHRNEWFLDRIGTVLADRGVTVVARVDNGADAIGQAVAEQPDLLLVEDTLAMVPGEDVVREVLRFCPSTRVVAHVAYADRVEAMLGAGATEVFTRRVSPADVAEALHRLVTA